MKFNVSENLIVEVSSFHIQKYLILLFFPEEIPGMRVDFFSMGDNNEPIVKKYR